MHYKKGNTKIDNSCLVSCLPTAVCFGSGKQCKGCYAKNPEKRFPAVLPSRKRNLAETKGKAFVVNTIAEIVKSKRKKVRIHESGDFYSQDYINKYVLIIKSLPKVKFYSYTKKLKKLNFSQLLKLKNFNLVNSVTPLGLNYGDMDYCKKLKKIGYKLCPCGIDDSIICMRDCNVCLTNKKVCFIQH